MTGPAGVSDIQPADPRPPVAGSVLAASVALALALHIATAIITPYGLQRDEFLYLAMGAHLHLWGMDFPPAMAILAQVMRATVGVGLVAVRIVPALASTLLVVFAVLFARELGGRRFAQALAGLTIIVSPALLRSGTLFQPVVLDQLAWTLVLFSLVRLSRSGDPRWWIALGVAAGLGLLAKFSIVIVGAGVLGAVAMRPDRRWLATRWPWIAALAAFAIGSPSIVGQIHTGWPALIYERELAAQQLVHVTMFGFFSDQLQMLGLGALLAVAGLWEYWRREALRVVAVTCLITLAILLAFQGKAYYLLPVYPALVGAGSAWLERMTNGSAGRRSSPRAVVRAVAVVIVAAYGVVALPFGLPVLPPNAMARYASRGSKGMVTTNTDRVLRLPQDYADMLHWRERVLAVARVYDSLPPAERARAVIGATNYGEAGAIDYYGPAMGLPRAICGCGTYWFFGPGEKTGEVLVTIGVTGEQLRQFYGDVRPAGRLVDPWAVPEEQDVPLFVSTDPVMTLQQLWPRFDPRLAITQRPGP
ncbi:MAG TPA: glycosyltransferase family 39 protein [Gemmatimonadaceae bacterium]